MGRFLDGNDRVACTAKDPSVIGSDAFIGQGPAGLKIFEGPVLVFSHHHAEIDHIRGKDRSKLPPGFVFSHEDWKEWWSSGMINWLFFKSLWADCLGISVNESIFKIKVIVNFFGKVVSMDFK